MWTNRKYIILAALFALVAQTSCTDDAIVGINDVGVPTEITDGYSLNLMVTLDKMGGTSTMRDASIAAVGDLPQDLVDMENYIDPEKFRVLFFDKNDKFLFESKSRWVKKLTQTDDDHTDWFVSIPVFSYGNDTEYEWDWVAIRDKLVKEDFKIAVLANRPGKEIFPELSDNKSDNGGGQKDFDNTGPHWGKEQTIWYAERHEGVTPKDIFDLHHSQYDPIYENKNNNMGHYDFIMAYEDVKGEQKPFMSSTSSWVSWGDNNDDTDKDYAMTKQNDDGTYSEKTWRHAIQPSKTNPIPMYGIQSFEALGMDWKEGTAINLERDGKDKPISLLRSVVRIELLIPKYNADGQTLASKPTHMALWFPNIYARCEPMDVWTPTDQIWGESLGNHISDKCEIDAIMNYGPITTYKSGTVPPAYAYQERLSWIYGAWKEKGWQFKDQKGATITVAEETNSTPYPRIFNPCIQRNNTVWCDRTEVEDPNFYRWVVYTGERNVNDPTKLEAISDQGNILYWSLSYNDHIEVKDEDADFYYVPVTDYSNPNNPVYSVYDDLKKDDKNTTTGTVFGPHKLKKYDAGNCETDLTNNYMNEIKGHTGKNLPYPLIRNHVYRLILAPTETKTYAYCWDFTKDLTPTTINNLNEDDNWSNPGGTEIKTLSGKAFPDDFSSNKVNTTNLKWGEGATLTREGGTIQTSEQINGETSIKTKGKFTLTVPNGKLATELTLYSYINVSMGNNTETIFSANVTRNSALTIDKNSKYDIASTDASITGGTMCAYNNSDSDQKIINNTNGKYYFYFNTNSLYYEIALNKPLEIGDVISTTLYSGQTSTRGILISNSSPRNTSSPSITISTNSEVENCTYTVKDGDGLAGASTIYINRYDSGINFTNFKIIRTIPPEIDPTYWSEVNGTTYTEEEKGMHFFSDQKNYDKYVFPLDPTKEITFTNAGEQACFIAEVRMINEDGKPEYWELQSSLNGDIQTANKNAIYELQGLKFNSSDDGTIYIYEKENKICVTGTTTITLPNPLKTGYTITVKGKSSTEFGNPGATDCVITANSGLELDDELSSNTSGIFGNNTNECTFTWKVTADDTTPVFTLSENTTGIDFYEISVNLPATSSNRSANTDSSPLLFRVKSEDLHSKSISFDNLLKYKK